MLTGHQPTECELEEIKDIFDEVQDSDLALIQEIIYLDGWSDYEEAGGLLVFRGVDDCLYAESWGKSPYGSVNRLEFEETNEIDAQELIDEMERVIRG